MQVRGLQDSDDRRVRGVMMSYLEGTQGWKWVLSQIGSYRNDRDGDLRGAAQILASLRGYGDSKRYDELSRWFDSVLGNAGLEGTR